MDIGSNEGRHKAIINVNQDEISYNHVYTSHQNIIKKKKNWKNSCSGNAEDDNPSKQLFNWVL